MRILVVEDYLPLRESIQRGLVREGHSVDGCGDGGEALAMALTAVPDLVVLDLMLPGLDGFEFLRRIRSAKLDSSVLVLTARDGLEDRVRGLDAGADDYLVKPFAFEEFLARSRALLRRRGPEPVLRVGDLELDTRAHTVRRGEAPISLTSKEFEILEFLARRNGEPTRPEELHKHLHPGGESGRSNVVEVYVGYLRRKLESGGRPRLLHTRRGFGYVLEEKACA
jgi:DNA-binding response OmpR family regulator